MSIHPETKVGELLERYPALEEVLIGMVPAFSKLRNPVLRKTVAKVATLEQAARVGGIELRELVTKLRNAAGIVELPVLSAVGGMPAMAGAAPEWVRQDRVREDLDGMAMLSRGVHPIGKIRELMANAQPGDIIALRTSFRPEPLIETMRKGGLRVHSAETMPGQHTTWFGKP